MITSRGTTPTYELTFPEDIDFTQADEIIVTFSEPDYDVILELTGTDIEITEDNVLSVYLTQEQTLLFTTNTVLLQVNWTYQEGGNTRRCASDIAKIKPVRNLKNEVI